MLIRELINILAKMPQDAIVAIGMCDPDGTGTRSFNINGINVVRHGPITVLIRDYREKEPGRPAA